MIWIAGTIFPQRMTWQQCIVHPSAENMGVHPCASLALGCSAANRVASGALPCSHGSGPALLGQDA